MAPARLLALVVPSLLLGCALPEDDDPAAQDVASIIPNEGGGEQAPAGPKRAATFFTYNMCGADSKCSVADPTAAVLENVLENRPDAFALQEVCQGQADEISRELRKRNIPYVQRFQNAASKVYHLPCGGFQGWGNAIFHVGTSLGEIAEAHFEAQAPYFKRSQNRGYVCLRVPEPSFWACSTHVDVYEDTQAAQVDELDDLVQDLTTRGGVRVPVVVGGDFNVQPGSDHLDGIFSSVYARGDGHLLEDQVARDRTFSPDAATHGTRKIDYVFHTPDVTVRSSQVVEATSDHRLVLSRIALPASR